MYEGRDHSQSGERTRATSQLDADEFRARVTLTRVQVCRMPHSVEFGGPGLVSVMEVLWHFIRGQFLQVNKLESTLADLVSDLVLYR